MDVNRAIESRFELKAPNENLNVVIYLFTSITRSSIMRSAIMFGHFLLFVILCDFGNGLTYTYSVKSINLDSAPDASRYTGLNPEGGWQTSIEDPHAVHGITASDGSYILVGKAETTTSQDAFAVKISSTGKAIWTWRSRSSGGDAANGRIPKCTLST